MRLIACLCALLVSMGSASFASAAETIQLFNGKDFSGWKYFTSDPNVQMEQVWTVRDGVIHCAGKPAGYIRTEQDFTNFVLKFEWRTLKKGNSGCLIRVQEPDKIWPKSVECQLNAGDAGDIWVIDEFPIKFDPASRRSGRHVKKLAETSEKPAGEWNQYEITADRGNLTLKVNGVLQNQGTDMEVVPGKILLQSEGQEIEFRNLELTPIGDDPSAAERSAGQGAAAGAAREGKKLFNGKDLSGWSYYLQEGGKMEQVWTVKDGVIHCTGSPTGFLKTEQQYKNFNLRLKWRWPDKTGNSGVLLRAQPPDAVWPKCFEAQLMHENAGDIWLLGGFKANVDPKRSSNGRTVKLQPSSEKPVGEWNQYDITMNGGKAELKVNGVVQNTATDCEQLAGVIGLQSEGVPIEFKDIEIVELPDAAAGGEETAEKRRLAGLEGWHITGNGNWVINDGVIEGKQPESERSYTHVVSDKSYRDFKATLKFKAVKGNSGFYFRVKPEPNDRMVGIQAEIDEKNNVGGLYESYGRNWLSLPPPERVASYFKPQQWNEMTVEGRGPHVVVHINGQKAGEINDPTIRTEGPFALQIHGGQDVHVMFKDIHIEPIGE